MRRLRTRFRHLLVSGNVVFGHVGKGIWIVDGTASHNVVRDNGTGIFSADATVSFNRVHDNSLRGIHATRRTTLTGNVVYSNPLGVFLQPHGLSTTIRGNVLYANPDGPRLADRGAARASIDCAR